MPIHRHVVELIGVYQQQDTYRVDYHHPPQRTQNQSPCSYRYLSTNKNIKTINSSSLSKYPKMLLLNLKGCLPKFSYLKVSEKLENVGILDSGSPIFFEYLPLQAAILVSNARSLALGRVSNLLRGWGTACLPPPLQNPDAHHLNTFETKMAACKSMHSNLTILLKNKSRLRQTVNVRLKLIISQNRKLANKSYLKQFLLTKLIYLVIYLRIKSNAIKT